MEYPESKTRAVSVCQICTRPLGGMCVATQDSRVICKMCHEFTVQMIQKITDPDQALETLKRELSKSYPKEDQNGKQRETKGDGNGV